MASPKGNSYLKSLRKFINAAERKKEKRRKQILGIMRGSLPEFIGRFEGVEKISIIGSMAKGRFYSTLSDVDILVKGLRKEDYFKAFRFWEDRLGAKIDLIREEEIARKMRCILKHEEVIYEKG